MCIKTGLFRRSQNEQYGFETILGRLFRNGAEKQDDVHYEIGLLVRKRCATSTSLTRPHPTASRGKTQVKTSGVGFELGWV